MPGAILEISSGEIFDAYQWFEDGVLIPGATTSTYTASTAGDYFLRVTRGPCTYDSNSISVYYCDPDVILNKSVDQNSVYDGTDVIFTITVENFWDEPITNLVLTDILPDGLEFVSASVSLGTFTAPNWNVGGLNPGQLETLTLTAKALITDIYLSSQVYTNTVTNSQDQTDLNITTDNPSVDVTVNMIPPTSVITNRRITYRVKRN